jgi:hypothetical protein
MTSDHAVIIIWLLVGLIIFFAPAWAARPGKRWAIFFVVLFFGWTGIGWGVAVIMSARSREGVK